MSVSRTVHERRVALGYTQEQLAAMLHVTASAVNKWERGATLPDVALLPRLARALKTDLNTLLCFRETLTAQEIADRLTALIDEARSKGIAAAFDYAEEELREWPHCDQLLLSMALALSGQISLQGLSHEEAEPYDRRVTALFERASRSGNESIRHSAEWMLVSRCLAGQATDKAQEVLDRIPDPPAQDKRLMQIRLLIAQDRNEAAAEMAAEHLLRAVMQVQAVASYLMEIELRLGNTETAGRIASQMSVALKALDMNAYTWTLPLFIMAAQRQNAEEALTLAHQTLEAMRAPWSIGSSPLYARAAKGTGEKSAASLLPAVLRELRNDECCAFLRGNEAFEALLRQYETVSPT